ncbi:hypothetical protein [Chamaesiphon sp. VAR_48_metabat_135_sub]|uniref:hypothetical protein n=1 Tax=Chamaesiphon sp. VAR_48_metabat_135_sub TaxID=2964699 RepID=UPI00286B48BE|nr:hypothetical protein [Chamaesiphon sp. VAR_48_metabat_135_sub]
MNKVILSLLGCSSSIATVLVPGSIASPDPAKTIPYPEVINLKRVPIFDAYGMVPRTAIASKNSPIRSATKPPLVTANPIPITVDLVSKTVGEVAIKKHGSDSLGYRHLAPSMMVLGYSSPSNYSRRVMY